MVDKTDYKKLLKPYYNPSIRGFHIITVPEMGFLMVDGKGDPNTSETYQQAVEALYAMSYGIKFKLKSPSFDYIVPPLEGLWWMENMDEFTLANKPRWEWTMMLMQPERVTNDIVENIREKTNKKLKNPAVSTIRFESYTEGLSLQTIYFGAYENEAPVIAEMHRYIAENGYLPDGKHHEIYLGDPRKTAAEKLKTILRQPIKKA